MTPLDQMHSLSDEVARNAHSALRRKLDAAALHVLQAGDDWAEGPVRPVEGHDPFTMTVTIPTLRLKPGEVPPYGWRVVRHADWVAAGRPGL